MDNDTKKSGKKAAEAIADIPPEALGVGVDVGGTNIQFGIIDPAGHVLSRHKIKTQSEDGRDAVIDRIVGGIEAVCDDYGVESNEIGTIGLGAPGPVDPQGGVVLEAPNLRWKRTPMREMLAERYDQPIFIENDVNVAVFGENRCGAGRGASNLIGAWVGTGIGAALVLDGRLFYGHLFSAGELGHTILMPGNAPGTRSLEHNCSRAAIVNRLIYLIHAGRASMIPDLVGGRLDRVKSRVIAEAFREGDDLTVEVIEDAGDRLGIALANAVTLLSLERVILGGGLVEALGGLFVDRVTTSVRTNTFPSALKKKITVVASELGDDAGIVGAGLIAMHRLGV